MLATCITYTINSTVHEYLWLLQLIAAKHLAPLGRHAMVYSAAAVSDFYVPHGALSEHKVQSSDTLTLTLSAVPKCLALLRARWAPQCFLVSFKLETDPALLLPKARAALTSAGVHLVVANELHTRYRRVTLVSAETAMEIDADDDLSSSSSSSTDDDASIERQLVAELAQCHFNYVAEGDLPAGPGGGASPRKPLLSPEAVARRRWKRRALQAVHWAAVPAALLLSLWLQRKLNAVWASAMQSAEAQRAGDSSSSSSNSSGSSGMPPHDQQGLVLLASPMHD
jgi:DNA / pantothenate metabolism flavoprotein